MEGQLLLRRRHLHALDIRTIREVFRSSDLDEKGYLSREDIKVAVLNLFGYKPTKYEVDQFMKLSDEKGLTIEKFTQIMTSKLSLEDPDQEIRQTFHMFDLHCQGFLTLEDVKTAFQSVAPNIKQCTVLSAFKCIDSDNDGRISYRDFEAMMKYTKSNVL